MIPRYKMSIVNDETEIDRIAYFMAKEGYSRYPVYHNKEDNITGYIHLIDVMRALNSDNREDELSRHISPVIKVGEEDKIYKLFKKMIKERVHIAIVYGKNKNLIGMLSLEDILEEIVGEIRDENDDEVAVGLGS
jgi:CBS domain containing-hemolysin-like protein